MADVTALKINIMLAVGLVTATGGMGVTWGAYSKRIEVVERDNADLKAAVRQLQEIQIEQRSDYKEILRYLRRRDAQND
jgi:hypothetical protein